MVMRICQVKHWSLDDWQALSDNAQEYEIAWYEYQHAKYLKYLDLLEEKLPRDKKSNLINAPEAYYMLLLKRLELL
jgi:hypothetical protein